MTRPVNIPTNTDKSNNPTNKNTQPSQPIKTINTSIVVTEKKPQTNLLHSSFSFVEATPGY